MLHLGRQSIIRLVLIALVLVLTGVQTWCVIDGQINDVSQGERLFIAVSAGDSGKVRSLLRQGVSPAWRDAADMTPLMCAASCGYREIAEMLIASGSPVEAQDRYGMTALLHAVRGGDVGMVTLLLNQMNADDRPASELEALAFANEYGSNQVASFLQGHLRARRSVVPASFSPAARPGRHGPAL